MGTYWHIWLTTRTRLKISSREKIPMKGKVQSTLGSFEMSEERAA